VSRLQKKRAQDIFHEYREIGYNLAGIGVEDLAAGCQFLKGLDPSGEMLVSANLYCNKRPAFSPFRIFNIRGVRVAVVGLSDGVMTPSLSKNKDIVIRDNDPVLGRYMAKMAENADLVIGLSSMTPGLEMAFIRKFPKVALLISSGRTYATNLPTKLENCLIVSSHPRGESIGLITLYLKRGDKGYVIKGYKNRLYMLKGKTGKRGCGQSLRR